MTKASSLEKKAAAIAAKEAQKKAEAEAAESEKWNQGAKKGGRKEKEEAKKKEKAAAKAELEMLKKQEEMEMSKYKKKSDERSSSPFSSNNLGSFAASNIDDAITLLQDPEQIASNSVSGGGNATLLDRHPERRMKAAFAAFEEKQMPKLKKDYPGLRLSQLKEMLQKMWRKSPDNPMNVSAVAYNSSAQEIKQISKSVVEKDLERMRI